MLTSADFRRLEPLDEVGPRRSADKSQIAARSRASTPSRGERRLFLAEVNSLVRAYREGAISTRLVHRVRLLPSESC